MVDRPLNAFEVALNQPTPEEAAAQETARLKLIAKRAANDRRNARKRERRRDKSYVPAAVSTYGVAFNEQPRQGIRAPTEGGLLENIYAVMRASDVPMTSIEVAKACGCVERDVSRVLVTMSRPTPMLPKRAYVADWCYTQPGRRSYPRPLWALGDSPDMTREKSERLARERKEPRALGVRASMREHALRWQSDPLFDSASVARQMAHLDDFVETELSLEERGALLYRGPQPEPGSSVDARIWHLMSQDPHRPWATIELCDALRISVKEAEGALRRLHRPYMGYGKRVFLADWILIIPGYRINDRALWMLGSLDDMPKKKSKLRRSQSKASKEISRSKKKNAPTTAVSSVFDLGYAMMQA